MKYIIIAGLCLMLLGCNCPIEPSTSTQTNSEIQRTIDSTAWPELLKKLERAPWHDSIIPQVLIQIRDSRCVPHLLAAARQQKDCVFPALACFRVREAVPILMDILNEERIPKEAEP